MAESRTKNAKRNIIYEFANMMVSNLLPFITRTIIIYVLGKEFLGLNSLFSSILQVLSLAELGFGSAVVFSMYKPLAEHDNASVNALLKFYRTIYRYIGIGIGAAGLLVMPFLNFIIKGSPPAGVNIYVLYLINLLNTVLSYFLFAYKQSLLKANQRADITSKINMAANAIDGILKVVILLIWKNYYLFCIIMPITTAAKNIASDVITRKMYPQYVCEGEVPFEEKDKIKKNVVGLLSYKISYVFRNSFDSIVLSAFMGLGTLASYNNYYYIMNTITNLISTITNSMIAGIGNKLVLSSKKDNHNDMMKFQLLCMWIDSWCTVCLFCLYQPFMKLWVGEDLMFDNGVMIVFCIYFFVKIMNLVCYAYRQAAGLWWEDRFRPMAEAFCNLGLNILLVRYIGVLGVLLSTVFTLIPFNTVWGSWILYKKYFTEENPYVYLGRLVYFGFAATLGCLATGYLCLLLPITNLWMVIIGRGILCVIIPNVIFIILFRMLPEYKSAMNFAFRLVKKHRN